MPLRQTPESARFWILSPKADTTAKSFRLRKRFFWIAISSGVVAFAAMLAVAGSFQPQINFIERYATNQVLIHFDTEAGHTYYLQYSTSYFSTNWTDLYTGFNYPFPDHYIIPDTGTNATRYYRLRVTTP